MSAWKPTPMRPPPSTMMGGGETVSQSPLDKIKAALVFPRNLYISLERLGSYYIDRTVPRMQARWISFAVALMLYMLRVYVIGGFFIVTYALGIYLLNLLIGFLTPAIDPEEQDGLRDVSLPQSGSDSEFRPFARKLPEFQFWFWGMRAVVLSIGATFFRVFDLPVFWPILLFYFIFLFVITMKQQIAHMIKHKYVPWSTGDKSSYK
jgi:hypothetical protein